MSAEVSTIIHLGDIGAVAPLAMETADTSLSYQVEILSMAALDEHRAEWLALLGSAVDDNPFMSPAFLIPLSMHTDMDAEVSMVAIWQTTNGKRRLAGLVPLAAQRWKYTRGLLGRGQANLWKHAFQPFALPLLAGTREEASLTLRAFFSWLQDRWPRIRSFAAHSLDTRSHFCEILAAQSMERLWPLQRSANRSSTRGLDFRPAGMMLVSDKVQIMTGVTEVRAGIEQMLGMDAMNQNRISLGEAALLNPQRSAFLRAAIRSFAAEGKAIVAMLDTDAKRAGAVVLNGRDKGYLWWVAGTDEGNPVIEASLAAAAEKALNKPVAAACQARLAGLWAEPIRTEDWLMALEAERRPLGA
ncbi:MAG: hypothetical protein ACRCWF_04335 [Beijerinckiaceae bacterium]